MVDEWINEWSMMLECGKHCTECEYFDSIQLECNKPDSVDTENTW